MAPSSRKARISQEAFDAAVRENVEEFGMEEEEAVADALHTFQLQGVDLSGIISDGRHGEEHPVISAIRNLGAALDGGMAMDQLEKSLDTLRLVSKEDNVSIALRNGAIGKVVEACRRLVEENSADCLPTAMKTLLSLLGDDLSKKEFFHCGGPKVIVNVLSTYDGSSVISSLAATAMASAASGSEILKEEFVHLKAEERLINLTRSYKDNAEVLSSTCDALRALVCPDDASVPASNAFKNARTIWKAGAVGAILDAASGQKDPTLLATFCTALRAMAASDEICKSIAASSGLDLTLQFVDYSSKITNKSLAKNACSLLTQLALSDANKDAIVSQGGCQKLVTLATTYSEDVSVIQEVMSALASLTLRSSSNATQAVDAGAIDLAAEMMDKHPQAAGMQKQTCHMLRNLASRNPENRTLILERGLEQLIRAGKARHASCKDASSAALRDLGLENYN